MQTNLFKAATAFCRTNSMRLTRLWSFISILKSPWEAVRVSELCWGQLGAALAKPRVVLYGTGWDGGAGPPPGKAQSCFYGTYWDAVLGWWRSWASLCSLAASVNLGSSRAAGAASQGFIIGKKRQTPPSFPPLDSWEGSEFHTEIIMLLEKLLWQLPAPQGEFLWGKSHVRHTSSFPFLPLLLCAGTALSWSTRILPLASLTSFTSQSLLFPMEFLKWHTSWSALGMQMDTWIVFSPAYKSIHDWLIASECKMGSFFFKTEPKWRTLPVSVCVSMYKQHRMNQNSN